MSEKDQTVGEGLIEQNKTVITLLKTLVKQNEEKLTKAEAMLNLLGNIGRNQEQTKLAHTNIPDFNTLPWKTNKYGEWIFSNTRGAEKLVELIHESTAKKVPIKDYEYQLSGQDDKFINRRKI